VLGRRVLGPSGGPHPPAHLGLAMNGGVLHAIESHSAEERAAAFDGYRYIGLEAAANYPLPQVKREEPPFGAAPPFFLRARPLVGLPVTRSATFGHGGR
jgi:hypothetical protein